MSDKLTSPIQIAAAGTALTSSAAPIGSVTFLGKLRNGFVHVDYTRHALSTSGRPRIWIAVSRDAPPALGVAMATAAAAVTHWTGLDIGDGSSFSTGAVEMYYEALEFPTSSAATWVWTSIDLEGYWWMQVWIMDMDSAHPGTCGVFLTGGV